MCLILLKFATLPKVFPMLIKSIVFPFCLYALILTSFITNDNKNDVMHNQSGKKFLDYNNDDYYDHGLDNCPDIKNSDFLKE